jgi:hypothetical protein
MTNPLAAAAVLAVLLVAVSGPLTRAIRNEAKAISKSRPHGHKNAQDADAVVHLKGVMENTVVGPLTVSGSYRVVESSKNLRMRNLRIQGLFGTDLQRDGVRLRGDIDGATIQNFRLAMRRQPQTEPNLPIGIAVQSGRGITISDGEVAGFQMVRVPGKYTNGDGIAAERQVQDLTISRVVSRNNSDGGFDLKSSNTKLDQLRAEHNYRNYRLWGTIDAGTLTSIDPAGAHLWAGNRAVVHIKRRVASSSGRAPLVQVDGARQVEIDSCDLRLPPGTPLVEGKTSETRVVLGRGCTIGR